MRCSSGISPGTTPIFVIYERFSELIQSVRFSSFRGRFESSPWANKSLAALEQIASEELAHIHEWLCANKLSLNIEKSNFVVSILLKRN